MSIDWSKAPEGATHYGPDCNRFEACWYKVDTDGEVFCMLADNDDEFERVTSLPENAIERPKEWTGTGLPPVGTVCEYLGAHDYREWTQVNIFAVWGDQVFVDFGDGWRAEMDASRFRPIRTQEQIEAEERENYIGDLACHLMMHAVGNRLPMSEDGARKLAQHLYLDGYRKQPKEGA